MVPDAVLPLRHDSGVLEMHSARIWTQLILPSWGQLLDTKDRIQPPFCGSIGSSVESGWIIGAYRVPVPRWQHPPVSEYQEHSVCWENKLLCCSEIPVSFCDSPEGERRWSWLPNTHRPQTSQLLLLYWRWLPIPEVCRSSLQFMALLAVLKRPGGFHWIIPVRTPHPNSPLIDPTVTQQAEGYTT